MRSDIQENVNNAKVTAGCVKHSTALFPSPVLQFKQSKFALLHRKRKINFRATARNFSTNLTETVL